MTALKKIRKEISGSLSASPQLPTLWGFPWDLQKESASWFEPSSTHTNVHLFHIYYFCWADFTCHWQFHLVRIVVFLLSTRGLQLGCKVVFSHRHNFKNIGPIEKYPMYRLTRFRMTLSLMNLQKKNDLQWPPAAFLQKKLKCGGSFARPIYKATSPHCQM